MFDTFESNDLTFFVSDGDIFVNHDTSLDGAWISTKHLMFGYDDWLSILVFHESEPPRSVVSRFYSKEEVVALLRYTLAHLRNDGFGMENVAKYKCLLKEGRLYRIPVEFLSELF